MSVDTVFQPKLPTVLVGTAGIQIIPPGTGPAGMMTFRTVNLIASISYLGYGPTAAQAVANAAAPGAAGAYTIAMLPSSVETFEFQSTMFFAANIAAAFNMTPGQGA